MLIDSNEWYLPEKYPLGRFIDKKAKALLLEPPQIWNKKSSKAKAQRRANDKKKMS